MKSRKVSLREIGSAKARRIFLEKELKIELPQISQFNFDEQEVTGRNVENLIGATQVPLAVAGPITIHSALRTMHSYIPLATTEGALTASISRGCKAISLSGGADILIENVGITRGPVFKTKSITHSKKTKDFIEKNLSKLNTVAQKTSSHLRLTKADTTIIANNLFVRFYFDTKDAMGMNMATFATDEIIKVIEAKTGAKCLSIAGNFDIDKKPAWLNFISGRGKRAWAQVTIKKDILSSILKITPEKLAEVVRVKCQLGSIASGSIGFNAHYANIIAAIFTACGQDIAHTVEGSLGVTTAEVDEKGDLVFSVYLPSLVIGSVGGGTHLPTQKEALSVMGIAGQGDVLKFAEVVAATVLAGELSLLASLAQGTLATAHKKLGRKS
ncbi:MAG: hydroxymethylglutaryl-CoA reductase [Candidatus Curtissbacteria bacterium]|nr:hydroxymethylglutaryl-CoA reductase [Candidatus Curtissbacteria bacterium]